MNPSQKAIEAAIAMNLFLGIQMLRFFASWTLGTYPAPIRKTATSEDKSS